MFSHRLFHISSYFEASRRFCFSDCGFSWVSSFFFFFFFFILSLVSKLIVTPYRQVEGIWNTFAFDHLRGN